jgi:hypothetical protein
MVNVFAEAWQDDRSKPFDPEELRARVAVGGLV